MIRLNKNPVEGSAVKINVAFRDSFGAYYVPSELTYTLLALNSDKESWRVVDDYYKVSVTPESSVNITIPKISLIEGTELQRRIIVEWSGYVDGEYTNFKDEVAFDVDPMPYITDKPDDPEPSEVYIKITDVSLQVGSLETAPVTPVFKVRTSLPVNIITATINVKDELGDIIECVTTIDSAYTLLTIVPSRRLEFDKPYSLNIDGLTCRIGDYTLEEPYSCNFVTEFSNNFLQYDKEVTVTENGDITVEPDSGYDGMANLKIKTELPVQAEKTVDVDHLHDIEILPDDGFTSVEKVNVTFSVPVQDEKDVTYYDNGDYVVEPDDPNDSMKKVNVKVDIPLENDPVVIDISGNGDYTINPTPGKFYMKQVKANVNVPIQDLKSVTVSAQGTVGIEPDDGYTALKKVIVDVQTESQRLLYAYKDNGNTHLFYSTRRITGSGTHTIIAVPCHSVTDVFADCSIIKNGDQILLDYFGTEYTIARDSDSDIIRT